jgi:hypothetical protein
VSLNTMARRLSLEVPGIADQHAVTLLGEALSFIQDGQLWSFQLKDGGWLTPGLLFPGGLGVSVGTVTFTPYSNQVVGDATASAAWAAYGGSPPFGALQIRSPFYSIYNIVSYTVNGSGFGVFTLDRNWMEPGGALQSYMIYQCYFAVPVADFKKFLSIRDTTSSYRMDYWSKSQADLALEDPQRTVFGDPTNVVPYQQDQRPGSPTLGYMLYELWPHPSSILPYSFDYMRRGPSLIAPSDTVPSPLTEEVVLWQAKIAAYLWKEAQKGENIERGSGADYKFLSTGAEAKFKLALKPCKDKDRDMVDLYFNRFVRDNNESGEPFSTQLGQLNVGRM